MNLAEPRAEIKSRDPQADLEQERPNQQPASTSRRQTKDEQNG